MKKVVIYWVTKDPKKRNEIMNYFKIPHHTSVNGETEFETTDEVLNDLKRGIPKYLKIRNK